MAEVSQAPSKIWSGRIEATQEAPITASTSSLQVKAGGETIMKFLVEMDGNDFKLCVIVYCPIANPLTVKLLSALIHLCSQTVPKSLLTSTIKLSSTAHSLTNFPAVTTTSAVNSSQLKAIN